MSATTHRPSRKTSILIGLSVSYQRDNLLARGLGLEHLKELLAILCRPLLRHGVNLAYGGDWSEREENFTYQLLNLISAEREDQQVASPDPDMDPVPLGRLFNHSAWPNYLKIPTHIEAQWINCCRIVRISQDHAGLLPQQQVTRQQDVDARTDQVLLNSALTLSAMRRIMMTSSVITIPGRTTAEGVPPVVARVALGGKTDGYSGWLPGIFEEALLTLEAGAPLFLLGGFGGATELLARLLLNPAQGAFEEFTLDWHKARTPNLARLHDLLPQATLPLGSRTTEAMLWDLRLRLQSGTAAIPALLQTGLDLADNCELLQTRDMHRAAQLVRKGLESRFNFEPGS